MLPSSLFLARTMLKGVGMRRAMSLLLLSTFLSSILELEPTLTAWIFSWISSCAVPSSHPQLQGPEHLAPVVAALRNPLGEVPVRQLEPRYLIPGLLDRQDISGTPAGPNGEHRFRDSLQLCFLGACLGSGLPPRSQQLSGAPAAAQMVRPTPLVLV